jgi:putative DNA primase/helicase
MRDAENLDKPICDAWPDEIEYSTGDSHERGRMTQRTRATADFLRHVTTHKISETKYVSVWSNIVFENGRRLGEHAASADTIVLDIDNGAPLRRILFMLDLAGYAAAVVTSHSHMTTEKTISEGTWRKWREAHPHADEEEFTRSLDKQFVESVWRCSRIKRGKDGEPLVNSKGEITIEHGPCAKLRIIIPLRERLHFTDLGDVRERARLWAGLHGVVAGKLRVVSDDNAMILSQVFFDPRCPASRERHARVEFLDGAPFDWREALSKAREVAGRDARRTDDDPRRQSAALAPIFTDPRYDKSKVVWSALEAIGNKGIERKLWIKIGAALYVEFGSSAEGEELFEKWTALREEGNVKPEMDAASWRNFRSDRPDGSTGKTIRDLAYKAGWSPEEAGFPDYRWGDGWTDKPDISFEDERLKAALAVIPSCRALAEGEGEGDKIAPNAFATLEFIGTGGDIYNGGAFANLYRDRLLFIHESGDVLRFDREGGWLAAAPGTAERAAKAVVEILRNEATEAAHYQHLKKLCDARAQHAMIEMARSEPGMTRSLADFDDDPMLLGVMNGVLDLRSGRLLPISPDVLVSKRCNVAFDPEATCPSFIRFLAEVQPDDEIRACLKRFVGYCLTGDVGEQMFAFFHGGGNNGKSAFIELLAWLLGDYALKIPTEMLMQHQRNPQGPSPDIVALKGRRLIYANETEEGRRLADARVKDLTGGDTLTGRAPHAMAAICFRPSHKLVIVGNHKPAISDTSSGMWRRVALVPWTETVPPEKRDRHLVQKLMREGSGVLNWALDGLRDWRQHGLMIPDAIKDATASYREDEDILGDWLDEECEVGRGLFEKKVHAYASYHEWAERNGNRPLANKTFTRRVAERGFPLSRDRRAFQGFALSNRYSHRR